MKGFKPVILDGQKTRYKVSRSGTVIYHHNCTIHKLKVFSTKKGYLYVKLWINGKSKAEFVHRLVAKAYIPNPDNKPEVNHKDGDKSNCWDTNLEWVTSKENKEHARREGLFRCAFGERAGATNLSDKQVSEACRLMGLNNQTMSEISNMTGVSLDCLYGIRSKGLWKHISSKYNFPDVQKRNSRAYTETDIRAVCELLQEGKLSTDEIRELTGVKKGTINDIRAKRRWTYVSNQYKI